MSDKTFYLGHVPGTVIVDKTELDTLRAEVERLRAAIDKALQFGIAGHAGSVLEILSEALERKA